MIITGKIISELEDSLNTFLTPEQRVILLYWYGTEPMRFKWDKEDFVYGFHDVLRYYPDHRPKQDTDFLMIDCQVKCNKNLKNIFQAPQWEF